jgi:hypothetical protein
MVLDPRAHNINAILTGETLFHSLKKGLFDTKIILYTLKKPERQAVIFLKVKSIHTGKQHQDILASNINAFLKRETVLLPFT